MKKLLMLIIVMCSIYTSLIGQQTSLTDLPLKVRADSLARRILDVDLEINKLYWDTYLQKAEKIQRVIPVFALIGFDVYKLYDSVPNLKRLNTLFNQNEDALVKVLMKNRAYRKAQAKLLVTTDNAEKHKCQVEKQNVFAKLSKNEDYATARKERDLALVIQNLAITHYLLDTYQSQRVILPLTPIMSPEEIAEVREKCPQIDKLEQRRNSMSYLKARIDDEALKEEFGIAND